MYLIYLTLYSLISVSSGLNQYKDCRLNRLNYSTAKFIFQKSVKMLSNVFLVKVKKKMFF
jgi:hypothetical protein